MAVSTIITQLIGRGPTPAVEPILQPRFGSPIWAMDTEEPRQPREAADLAWGWLALSALAASR